MWWQKPSNAGKSPNNGGSPEKQTIMKRFIATILIPALMSAFPLFGSNDSRTKIDRLWKEYYEYESGDLPEKSAETLQKIIDAAKKGGLHYDFYKAWEEYALSIGFKGAACGPLVRSSYKAGALFRQATRPHAK